MPSFVFGDFELLEEQRALRLRGADVALQPLVFDLLGYLLRHRDRMVTKEELFDALWPGVIVTEGSLQRAVSLARGVLRQGGLENAIRSVPKHGYRFVIDGHPARVSADQTVAAIVSPIEQARALYAEWRWAEAIQAFQRSDAAGLAEAADLEQWALAHECNGEPGLAIDPLSRAVAAYGMGGNPLGAAHAALRLCKIHLVRNETAVAKGWARRAADLIGDNRENREFGLLLWMQARLCSSEGQPERALELADQAYALGRAIQDQEVEAVTLMFRGFFRLILGQTRDGIADQDHAATLALSPAIDPVHRSTMYCVILWTCRNMGDWARAVQWTLEYQRWAQFRCMNYSGACQLHRAEVLSVQGTLREAEERIQDALRRLPVDEPWAHGDGLRVLGDIYLAMGEGDRAQHAYQQAHEVGWDPQPGYAMLLLERGDAGAALRMLERALDGVGWVSLQRRGLILAHLALVAASAGNREKALEAIASIEREPDRWPMPALHALIAQARAMLLRDGGEPAQALRQLERARGLWDQAESPVHVVEVRLGIAGLLLERGDVAGAELEEKAARAVAGRLESPRLKRQCDEMRMTIGELRASRSA